MDHPKSINKNSAGDGLLLYQGQTVKNTQGKFFTSGKYVPIVLVGSQLL